MNSIINAASSVTEAIWGKSTSSANASGEEPPNEPIAAGTAENADAPTPYDPGNIIDTAPAPTTTAPAKEGSSDGAPTAIPAPGNAEQAVASPTEGAGPTKTEDSGAVKEEEAVTSPTKTDGTKAEPVKQEEKKAGEEQTTPTKKTTTAVAAAGATPERGRSDSPPTSTPGSGRRGLRTKLKEKLHIGSQSPSGRKKD